MISLSEHRYKARQILTDKWGSAALCYLIIAAIMFVTSTLFVLFTIVPILASAIFLASFSVIFLKLARTRNEIEFIDIFSFFKESRLFLTICLTQLYIFLWSLLLVVPGIIKSYSYALTPYILIDNPNMKYDEAIDKSIEMMRGNKFRLFCLDLSFIGWVFLCLFTFGIGIFFLVPYIYATRAIFYENLKDNNINSDDGNIHFSFKKNEYYKTQYQGSNNQRREGPSASCNEVRKDGYDKTKY